MRVVVKLFAVARERAGMGELSLDLPAGTTVGAAAAALRERVGAVGELGERVAYAVNRAYAPAERVLRDGDELAVIPPVSGG